MYVCMYVCVLGGGVLVIVFSPTEKEEQSKFQYWIEETDGAAPSLLK